MEFVETQNARFFGNFNGYRFERVGFAFESLQSAVDFRHKGVEMDASFAAVGQAAVKRVHQKTFAAPYSAVEIQPFGQLGRTQAAAEKAVALAFEHHQFRPQAV